MEKKVKKIHSDQWLKDLPIQAENPAFKPEEMIVCVKCERKNPPTRLNCFYCGAELEISEMQSQYLKPNLRKLEIWEKEFNLIYQPKLLDETKIAEIAKMLRLEKAGLQVIQRVPIEVEIKEPAAHYLRTKREKLGHLLED